MSSKECCSQKECDCECKVKVVVEVHKIIKYVTTAAVLIVGIIFGTLTFRKMMENGFFDIVE